MSLYDVYVDSLGYWLERQDHFESVLGDGATYVCETTEGRIRFQQALEERVLKVQILATVAGGYWLWSWAKGDFPPELTMAAVRLRQVGAERQIEALCREALGFDEFWTEQKYAAIACAQLDGQATFRWSWGEGTIIFLIDDPAFPEDARPLRDRVFPTVRDLYMHAAEIAYESALRAYLARHWLEVEERVGGGLVARFPGGDGLAISWKGIDELELGFL